MIWKSSRSLFTTATIGTAAVIGAATAPLVLATPAMAGDAGALTRSVSTPLVVFRGSVPSQEEGSVPSDDAGEDLADGIDVEEVQGDAVPTQEEAQVEAPSSRFSVRSAAGSAAVQTFSYTIGGATINVPTGCALTHVIKGSGRKIRDQIAGVDCVGPAALLSRFCNARIEFHYADTSGKTYRITRGPLHTTCKVGTVPTFNIKKDRTLPKYGKACAQLFVNGKRRAVQCHFITR
ncbi:hypothetical protein WME73_19965 [Sorangium sp. So ce302]|uniref:hypothetical protein n=1 Tax=unclassified Sorangium TaxID=2621164 RepID=UPI003F5D851A